MLCIAWGINLFWPYARPVHAALLFHTLFDGFIIFLSFPLVLIFLKLMHSLTAYRILRLAMEEGDTYFLRTSRHIVLSPSP